MYQYSKNYCLNQKLKVSIKPCKENKRLDRKGLGAWDVSGILNVQPRDVQFETGNIMRTHTYDALFREDASGRLKEVAGTRNNVTRTNEKVHSYEDNEVRGCLVPSYGCTESS